MRTIEISTEVFASLWAHRVSGEETEDAILKRLLGIKTNLDKINLKSEKKVLWRDDVRRALEDLGGSAHLEAIYSEVRRIRRSQRRSLPVSTDAIVRRELEYNSSDTESFQGKLDWFKSKEGLGSGMWALR